MPSQTSAPPVPPLLSPDAEPDFSASCATVGPLFEGERVGGAQEEPPRAGFQFAHTLIEGVPETVIADKRPGDPVITSPEKETVTVILLKGTGVERAFVPFDLPNILGTPGCLGVGAKPAPMPLKDTQDEPTSLQLKLGYAAIAVASRGSPTMRSTRSSGPSRIISAVVTKALRSSVAPK